MTRSTPIITTAEIPANRIDPAIPEGTRGEVLQTYGKRVDVKFETGVCRVVEGKDLEEVRA